jgi:DNA-binding transcriptional regulator YbjK
MSKKKFTSGLDDLFADDAQSTSVGSGMSEISVRQSPERKHSHVKSFASDLDALLQDALEESLERMDTAVQNNPSAASKTKSRLAERMTSAFSGLDALIRETIDVQELTQEEATGIKRLTVAVDRAKLEKLKAIARLENAYLKDLLVGLIDEYITDYTKEKGLAL